MTLPDQQLSRITENYTSQNRGLVHYRIECSGCAKSVKGSYMKMNYSKMNRLIPLLGIALVAGGVMAAATYLDLERKICAGEAFGATIDRLCADEKLSAVLKTLKEGDVSAAVQRLDLLLCDDILAVNSRLASADNTERAYAQDMFVRIARMRPRNSEITLNAVQELSNDQIEAERILSEACAGTNPADEAVVALH
jgi:hypothetical protein